VASVPLFDGVQVYYAYLCIYNLAVDMQLPIKWLKHIRVSDIDLLFIFNLSSLVTQIKLHN